MARLSQRVEAVSASSADGVGALQMVVTATERSSREALEVAQSVGRVAREDLSRVLQGVVVRASGDALSEVERVRDETAIALHELRETCAASARESAAVAKGVEQHTEALALEIEQVVALPLALLVVALPLALIQPSSNPSRGPPSCPLFRRRPFLRRTLPPRVGCGTRLPCSWVLWPSQLC